MNVVLIFKLSELRMEIVVVDVHQELLAILKADNDFFLLCSVESDYHVFYLATGKIVREESIHWNSVQVFQV